MEQRSEQAGINVNAKFCLLFLIYSQWTWKLSQALYQFWLYKNLLARQKQNSTFAVLCSVSRPDLSFLQKYLWKALCVVLLREIYCEIIFGVKANNT